VSRKLAEPALKGVAATSDSQGSAEADIGSNGFGASAEDMGR